MSRKAFFFYFFLTFNFLSSWDTVNLRVNVKSTSNQCKKTRHFKRFTVRTWIDLTLFWRWETVSTKYFFLLNCKYLSTQQKTPPTNISVVKNISEETFCFQLSHRHSECNTFFQRCKVTSTFTLLQFICIFLDDLQLYQVFLNHNFDFVFALWTSPVKNSHKTLKWFLKFSVL